MQEDFTTDASTTDASKQTEKSGDETDISRSPDATRAARIAQARQRLQRALRALAEVERGHDRGSEQGDGEAEERR